MLKTLKAKFMTAVMSIITVMLAAIFSLLIYFTYSYTRRDNLREMRVMSAGFAIPIMPPNGAAPPIGTAMQPETESANPSENLWRPIFTVFPDQDGTLTAFGGSDYDLTDKAFLQEIVDLANTADGTDGTIKKYHLRWIRTERGHREIYTFSDTTDEEKMLHGLIISCVGIGIAAEIVFFLLSLVLVSRMVRPTEEAITRQREFISDASHELKTPLTVIMTNAEMLTEPQFGAEQKQQFTDNILKMSAKMRTLVESMLELARMDQRADTDAFQPVDLSALTADSLMTFEPLYYENDRTLHTEIAENVQVNGDTGKLQQVIGILLDNALKYSEEGSEVTVKLSRQACRCVLSVQSKGAPLSKEDCKNVFKRFYRADKSRNDRSSYGLGLSIAQSIISEHKGEIRAESTADGNIFSVILCCTRQNA